ncbi:MAG: extracellular solute-binding protein [Acidiferrobacterales bacterium]|nr:extracellular solute-binding protein [Acidiferrobacterales bacterium]
MNNKLLDFSKSKIRVLCTCALAAISVFSQASSAQDPCPTVAADALEKNAVINVYSARKEALILPLLQNFQEAFSNHHSSEIQINLVTGKADGLLKRIELEGKATPADVFITVDAGRLHRAKSKNVLRAIPKPIADKVPSHLRDQGVDNGDGYWIGLSQRARPIYYSRKRADQSAASSYEMLAHPDNAGKLCIRSSGSIYNQSLVAAMIAAMPGHLERSGSPGWLNEETLEWARGQLDSKSEQTDPYAEAKVYVLAWAKQLVGNFARPPTGGDTDQILAVAAGQCDFSLANSYYFGRLVAKDVAIADDVGIIWPNQNDRGAHVNVSGAGITLHAKHPANAQCLLDYMLKPESQEWYARVNYEYPVLPEIPWADLLTEFGTFAADDLEMGKLGELNSEAVKIMDRAGWR